MTTLYQTDFEDGFQPHNGIAEVQVPSGWSPDWSDTQGQSAPNVRPEYRPETNPDHVYTGKTSAKLTHRFACFDAVLYLQLPVTPGDKITLTAHVQLLTERPGENNQRGGLAAQVGIDPHGHTDFTQPTVEWGNWWGQYQDDWTATAWRQLTCTTIAQADAVTVYLRAKVDYAVNVIAAFWDAVTVTADTGNPLPPGDPGQGIPSDLTTIAEALEQHAAQLRLIHARAGHAHARVRDDLAALAQPNPGA